MTSLSMMRFYRGIAVPAARERGALDRIRSRGLPPGAGFAS
jgi:hypothetical protein